MFGDAGEALEKGIGFKKAAWPILIRVAWVAFVTGHVFWVCGFLAWLGLASPFARASDQSATEARMAALEKASKVSAQIQIQSEIREQGYIYCSSSDERTRSAASRRIDELRVNLREIADIDEPRPVCR